MNTQTALLEEEVYQKEIPEFKAGDSVKVHCRITEGAKTRIQIFQGLVIGRHNDGIRSTFTVRKISFTVGVEKIFPLHSPNIEKIEVLTSGKVRRAKLYYIRELSGKKARIKSIDLRQGQTAKSTKPGKSTQSAQAAKKA